MPRLPVLTPLKIIRILEKNRFVLDRVKGSHYIFTKDYVEEIINLQPKGNLAKPYQVKQARNLMTKYKLGDIVGE